MVTGDHPHTALAIAREIGLVKTEQPVVISGDELRAMSPAQLQLALDAKEIIFARVAAEQKMLIVQALKKKGEIVAVTGDGVNDAPALKTADIGIAMGIAGTDVAKEAADLILLDDNFASIVAAIEEGRAVFENIRKFLTYILSSNIPELVPYLAFVLFRIPLPLTIIQILAVDLGTDMLPALALGAEKPDPGVMNRPPQGARRAAAVLGPDRPRVSVPRRAGGGGVDGGVLLRAGRGRLALRRAARQDRPAVSAGDHRLPGGDRGDAGGERVSLPPPAEIVAVFRPAQQPADPARHRSGAGPDPADRLYAAPATGCSARRRSGAEVWLLAALFAAAMWLLEEARKAWLRRRAAVVA